MKQSSSEDEQELSQDEIRTLGMAGSNVCSIDASHSPPRRPAATQSLPRALNSEQAKRRRARHSSRAVLTLQERTLLESIDESSEDRSHLDIAPQVTCPFCGELLPSQLDLNHHIGVSHAGPRPDVPRVLHADYSLSEHDYSPSEHVQEFVCSTRERSPGDFFLPPTLGNPQQNDFIVEGWRAAALPAVIRAGHDERGTTWKPRLKPSIFHTKLEEHHAPRLGPGISTSESGPAPRPTGFWGNDGAMNCRDKVGQEEKKEASQEEGVGDDTDKDDAGHVDDQAVYRQQGDHVTGAVTQNAEADKEMTSPRILPSLLWSNARRMPSRASQGMPSIDSVISHTADLQLDIPSPLEPVVMRRSRSNDDDDDEPGFSFNDLSGEPSPLSETSPILP
ncbi:hypothetical protein E4U42_000399 [Claviceps africana]|uniref:C2H2-type domain-containing protein n=1 Tax=Claviceps africana TaxID=83212 RepID=A0A8K0J0M8_9HYPO|nr:hypothetical protein E4U42_000399 [Claviceps africana]